MLWRLSPNPVILNTVQNDYVQWIQLGNNENGVDITMVFRILQR
jgi:hypothetical protein